MSGTALLTAVESAVGGAYLMPDGREFWIDSPVAQEIAHRAVKAAMCVLKDPTQEQIAACGDYKELGKHLYQAMLGAAYAGR